MPQRSAQTYYKAPLDSMGICGCHPVERGHSPWQSEHFKQKLLILCAPKIKIVQE